MGWASGSDIACEMIASIKKHVTAKRTRKALYIDLIETLDSHDWDTHDEAEGIDPVFDEAMEELHPREYDEDDE